MLAFHLDVWTFLFSIVVACICTLNSHWAHIVFVFIGLSVCLFAFASLSFLSNVVMSVDACATAYDMDLWARTRARAKTYRMNENRDENKRKKRIIKYAKIRRVNRSEIGRKERERKKESQQNWQKRCATKAEPQGPDEGLALVGHAMRTQRCNTKSATSPGEREGKMKRMERWLLCARAHST